MKHPDLNIKRAFVTLAIIFAGLLQNKASATPYLVLDSDPWGQTFDQDAMNAVYGAGNWTQANYATSAATIFQASTQFVMLEGGNNNTNMGGFVSANISLIENWVAAGGRLFMSAGPNYAGDMNWGFGGTVLTNQVFAGTITSSVPGNQIFTGPYTPTATTFTGGYPAHAWINGTGLTSLLYDANFAADTHPVLAYKSWGSGVVFFSGCTGPFAWQPLSQAYNVWNNIFTYVSAISTSCLSITCHADTTVYPDLVTCSSVVNFIPPSGVNTCVPSDTFFYTGSIVTYTVPVGTTSIHMHAIGAQGGNNGGRGADMQGDFAVTPGDVLKILVGGQGETDFIMCGQHFGAGGGGGSFVATNANVPLIVAGGGGGNMCTPNIGMDASSTTSGLDGNSTSTPSAYGVGGTGGNGATNSITGAPHAGNGGGFFTDGENGQCGFGGLSFLNGGTGGSGCRGNGGFGGGASGGNAGGGGGGGYSGGGGSYHYPGNGGGGGSYNAGTGQSNTISYGTGNGMVIFGPGVMTTLISGLAPGSSFPTGTTTEVYRINDNLGDTAYCTFNITVIDTTASTISCPSNVTTCNNTVFNIAPVVTGTNNCSVVTYDLTGATTGSGFDDASGTYFNTGTTIVKYKVANVNGNADSCSFSVTINPPTGLLAGNTVSPESITVNVVAPIDVRYTDCDLMASITPSGGNPVTGNTVVKVTLDNPLDYFNGQPYVGRHFDIEPGTSASSATATLSLYAYQYEFDAYNIAAGPAGLPPLPSNGIDNGNVRITQFHGVGTAPGNYPGSEELIAPAVTWDATYNHWVMTFDVNGFSGFYIHTSWSGPLAIEISDISAINKGSRNRVDWSTASETAGDIMTLERSTDGKTFTALTDMYATGKASNYSYWDERAAQGINYYRVRLTNAARKQTYTKVVSATVKSGGALAIAANPNPVTDKVNVQVSGLVGSNGMIEVTDPTGKRLIQVAAQGNNTLIDMSGMPSGIYFIKYTDDDGSVTTRVNKQ